jgi:hypothetical protein
MNIMRNPISGRIWENCGETNIKNSIKVLKMQRLVQL